MIKKYKHLLSPIVIKNTVFKNRLGSAPITPFYYTNEHTRPSEGLIEHIAAKAKGGVGVITISGFSSGPIKENNGPVGHIDMFSILSQRDVMRLIDRIHSFGTKISVELMIFSDYSVCGGDITGAAFNPNKASKGMLTENGMKELCERYAKNALQAKNVGFDMVMLHFGHGGLVSQFLSPFFNHRTDNYGGSLENRMRFPLMILKSVREAVGKDFLIEMRISGDEKREGGITIDQSSEFIKKAQEYIDIVNISTGGLAINQSELLYPSTQMPSDYVPPHPNAYNAAIIKRDPEITCLVSHQGGIQDLDEAEALIADGSMDFVYMARGLIADPEVAKKAYENRPEDVIPCIKCYHCVDTLTRFNCSVNPLVGQEIYINNIKPSKIERVAIIGGGPAGMKAAIVAAENGHKVTLFEKEKHLGGRLVFANKMGFKRGVKKLVKYLEVQLQKNKVNVKLNTNVTPKMIENGDFDHIIVAIGAENKTLQIKGLANNSVFASDIYERDVTLGHRVAIIGGGLSGTETAIYLSRLGHEVELIEATEDLCGGMHFGSKSLEYYRVVVGNLQLEKNVRVYLNTQCTEAGKDFIRIKNNSGEKTLPVNSILVCVGMKAKIAEAMKFWLPGTRTDLIGDCLKPDDIEHAIRSAYDAANNIGR
ncbi:MAG: FAD-dependent oxidoreductase [Erysipelotrichaceae bacterium]|jgi:2,4-dienoyl-CoA reductase-like NADH-dependent reductase (Old Yellow Enzyme family)/thioredoxin reductase